MKACLVASCDSKHVYNIQPMTRKLKIFAQQIFNVEMFSRIPVQNIALLRHTLLTYIYNITYV